MLKIALTNKLINALFNKLVGKFLAKKLGVDGNVTINELYAVEADGRVKVKIDAELDISSEAAEALINNI